MAEDLVEGWTEPIDATLLNDGRAFDATGMTLVLVLLDKTGAPVDTTGKADWLDQANSSVRYNPGGDDLKASLSPYKVRWQVTSGGGKVAFYPNKYPDLWTVRTP